MGSEFIVLVIFLQSLLCIIGRIALAEKKICTSTPCDILTEQIKERVMSEMNPCDDFYSFACGKLLQEKPNTNTTHTGSSRNFVVESNILSTNRLLELLKVTPKLLREEPKSFIMGKEFFAQCITEEDYEIVINNLKNLISFVGGFPTVDGDRWDESQWTYLKALRKFVEAGLRGHALVSISVQIDPDNSTNYVLGSQNPELIYDLDCMYKTPCKENAIREYVTFAVQLGANWDKAAKDAEEILEFESDLTTFITSSVSFGVDLKSRRVTLKTFSSYFNDSIHWEEYFKIVLRRESFSKENGDFIVVLNRDYLENVAELYLSSSKKLLANYMIWYNLKQLNYFPNRTRTERACLGLMSKWMQVMLSSLGTLMSNSSSYHAIEDMVVDLRNEMVKTIESSAWMDDETKRTARDKIENIGIRVGYNVLFSNYTLVDNFYKNLNLGKNFIQSLLNIIRHFNLVEIDNCYFDSRDSPFCKMIIESNVIMYRANAFYNLPFNTINVGDPLVHPPFFDENWPGYLNYGRVGFVIGHEITHALDTKGAKYTKDGNMVDWWGSTTLARFGRKANCFAHQYSKFKFFNGEKMQNINGIRTLEENVADLGGLKLAYNAYKTYVQRLHLPDVFLPGLEYTPDQLFFIGFAHFFCRKYTDDREYKDASVDSHTPNPLRVIGVLQNSPYFSTAFGCKSGDQMKKCELW